MIELKSKFASVSLDPENGGRIASINIMGIEILVDAASVGSASSDSEPLTKKTLSWGCYPLAPWVGRCKNGVFNFMGHDYTLPINFPPHAIHGTCFDRRWESELDEQSQTVEMNIALGPDWPFTGKAKQIITLNENSLDLILELSTAGEPFPASIGWHPWFKKQLTKNGANIGQEAELQFSAKLKYQRDEDDIPTGELVDVNNEADQVKGLWDDCFTGLASPPTITWARALAEQSLNIEVSSPASHWVIYNEAEHALCIEPQTDAANGLNRDSKLVTKDSPLSLNASIKWQIL